MITNEGKLFACGWNHRRQLGFDVEKCETFGRVWDLSGIVFRKICAGWDSSAAITDKDILYFWGSNVHGQLGLPCDDYPKSVKPIQLELKVKDVSMGMRHTALLDFNGNVWTSGCGKRGQLGLGSESISSDKFQKIPDLNRISNITCGQYHTSAWSNEDKVLYVWGDNTYGQLGSDVTSLKTFDPVKSHILEHYKDQVSEIYAGWTHNAALLNNGKAAYWGRNNYGQLGNTDVNKKFNIVEFDDKRILKLAVGSEHSICLLNDMTLWGWGWNEHSNTGIDSMKNVMEPTKIDNNVTNIIDISSGAAHNFVISKENRDTKQN